MRARLVLSAAVACSDILLLASCASFSPSAAVPGPSDADPDASETAPALGTGSPCSSGPHFFCLDFDHLDGGLASELPSLNGGTAFAIDDASSVSAPSSVLVTVDPSIARALAERRFDERARRVTASVAYRRDAYSDLVELNLFGVSITYAGGFVSCYTRVSENTGTFVAWERLPFVSDRVTTYDANAVALPKTSWGVQRIELDFGAAPHCALYVNDKLEASAPISSGLTGLTVGVSFGADSPKFAGDAGRAVMRYDDLVMDIEK